jgi:hypothetical protein
MIANYRNSLYKLNGGQGRSHTMAWGGWAPPPSQRAPPKKKKYLKKKKKYNFYSFFKKFVVLTPQIIFFQFSTPKPKSWLP